jgi:hypothetical protein
MKGTQDELKVIFNFRESMDPNEGDAMWLQLFDALGVFDDEDLLTENKKEFKGFITNPN